MNKSKPDGLGCAKAFINQPRNRIHGSAGPVRQFFPGFNLKMHTEFFQTAYSKLHLDIFVQL